MITDIEEFFLNGCGRCERYATSDCSTRQWHSGLVELRQICRGMSLTETLKWGHPCYVHANRNIVIIGALRNDFRLSFFNPALMNDPHSVLERQGPNTQCPDMIRFTENAQVARMRPTIESYLREAMDYAKAKIRPQRQTTAIQLPVELLTALNSDPELAAAFHGLTKGRQKSYVLNLISAKKSETRVSRIAKFRDKIIAGKGLLDR